MVNVNFKAVTMWGVWQVLSCRVDVQAQLLHQIPLFMVENKSLGMEAVCEFLSPFVNYSILRTQISDSSSSLFARNLMSSIMAVCCLFPHDAMPIFALLIRSLKYVPHKTLEVSWHEADNFQYWLEYVLDYYIIKLDIDHLEIFPQWAYNIQMIVLDLYQRFSFLHNFV